VLDDAKVSFVGSTSEAAVCWWLKKKEKGKRKEERKKTRFHLITSVT
jgi:hypothetical protein